MWGHDDGMAGLWEISWNWSVAEQRERKICVEGDGRMMKSMDMQEIKIGTLRPDCIPGIRSVTIDENKIECVIKQALMRVYYEDDPSWADCLNELGIIKRDAML